MQRYIVAGHANSINAPNNYDSHTISFLDLADSTDADVCANNAVVPCHLRQS